MVKCGERASERDSSPHAQAVNRFLGLSLGGAKSERTCLTVIDYYRKQDKAFVVDIYESIGAGDGQTADQVLLALIDEIAHELSERDESTVKVMAIDAPLSLPPCLTGCESECEGYESCKRSEVRWMRQQFRRAQEKKKKLKHFTSYSQRPVDLYFRYKHPEEANLFQDETMGANLAPQAARMGYLKRFLTDMNLIEVWPKLALYYMQKSLRLTKREVLSYRHIEEGVHVRERVLEQLIEKSSLFVYERDLKKFVQNIAAFDSLLCAWAALQYDLGRVVKFRSDLPLETGWVQIPEL